MCVCVCVYILDRSRSRFALLLFDPFEVELGIASLEEKAESKGAGAHGNQSIGQEAIQGQTHRGPMCHMDP